MPGSKPGALVHLATPQTGSEMMFQVIVAKIQILNFRVSPRISPDCHGNVDGGRREHGSRQGSCQYRPSRTACKTGFIEIYANDGDRMIRTSLTLSDLRKTQAVFFRMLNCSFWIFFCQLNMRLWLTSIMLLLVQKNEML